MNDIVNNILQTPIEIALGIDENNMTTARKLYDFLGLAKGQFSRWAKTNITDNQFATENEDYWGFDINVEGNNTRDFRLTAHFAKKLSMMQKNKRGEEARDYFTGIEEKVKQRIIDRSQLSPQMQMFYTIADEQAKMELEQKRQAEQIKRIEENQKAISTALSGKDDEDFTQWVNRCLSTIAESENYLYIGSRQERHKAIRNESYERLKQKRNCRLDDRVQKAIGRALEERPDIKKSELQKINKIHIIANDKDLRPAYELVIKEMMIYYCVS